MSTNRVLLLPTVIVAVLGIMVTVVVVSGPPSSPITPGQTVTDPGVIISTLYGEVTYIDKYIDVEISAYPVNWHEIPESERPWIMSSGLFKEELKRVFLDHCDRQTGAKINALEQLEDEVLVKYSNPERKNDGYNCPTGVVFWLSVVNFQKADSDYQEVMKVKAEQEEAERKKRDKAQRKLEVVRRHVSPPPDSPSPA